MNRIANIKKCEVSTGIKARKRGDRSGEMSLGGMEIQIHEYTSLTINRFSS